MIYGKGDIVRVFYDAKRLETGIDVDATILEPDGTVTDVTGLPELDGGSTPSLAGTYLLEFVPAQDGDYFIRIDSRDSDKSQPGSKAVHVNSTIRNAILGVPGGEVIESVGKPSPYC